MPVSEQGRLESRSGIDPRVEVHPSVQDDFQAIGLTSPDAFLDLSGEIVSGHPDRHVMRIVLADGRICYLKKEHRVRWKDRFENWRSGFGWMSKSVREGRMLQEMERRKVAAPPWLAFGEDGRGRAFLLNAMVPGVVDLRNILHSQSVGNELAIALGRFCAELHAASVDHPDLYAKHFLIDPVTYAITLLDWQRTEVRGEVGWPRRIHGLAALGATLPLQLSSRLRARFLWAYRRVARAQCRSIPSFASLARAIENRVQGLEHRRGIREQRQPPLAAESQRLVWLDGEALCAIPEVADDLRSPSIQIALYDQSSNQRDWTLDSGRQARRCFGSHRGWLRGRSWRAPEVRLARLLFHLERYHVVAPKLLAYGHRRNRRRVEAFVLHERFPGHWQGMNDSLRDANPFRRDDLLQRLASTLNRLHESGCEARTIDCLAVRDDDKGVAIVIPDPRRLVFRRFLSARRKEIDQQRIIRSMQSVCGDEELERFSHWYENESKR